MVEKRRLRLRVLTAASALLLVSVPSCAGPTSDGPQGDGRKQGGGERVSREGAGDPVSRPGGSEAGKDGDAAGPGGAASSGSSPAELLGRLRVAPEVGDGYDRDLFDHWADLGACDVRDLVLERQDRRDGPCGSESGRWFSAYDGVTSSDPGEFDVDHVVPLAEAWASGARSWPETRREAFANDLRPYTLIAVSASSNRSKSDQDPAEWMPENENFECAYVARWIAVKFRWSLTVDAREKAFLESALPGCRPRALRLVRIERVR